jgi:hypothetical protein
MSKVVFLMELADDKDPGSMTDDIEISLHTLTGLSSAKTMQLMITIASIELRELVDSGSTHTFIHDAVAHRLGLQVTLQRGLSIKVANGERLQSYGACRATTLTIQGEQFVIVKDRRRRLERGECEPIKISLGTWPISQNQSEAPLF